MKHIKLFEEFLNESSCTVEKNAKEVFIKCGSKEVMFSNDKETVNLVIKALEDKLKSNDPKKLWHLVSSKDGDIYIERNPNSKTILIKQSEDNSKYEIEFEISYEELKSIIKDLKKI